MTSIWIVRDYENCTGCRARATTDKALVEKRRLAYFDTLGWDHRGIPKKGTLLHLNLEFLESSMSKLRN